VKKALESVLEKNYPLNYQATECKQIGEFIKLKESFSIIGMKDVGVKNVMRFIAYRNDVQKKYLGNPAESEQELLYANLYALRETQRYNVIYVFGNTRSTENDYFFCQKRIWVKPFDQAGALGVIKRNEDRFQIKLTPEMEQKYLELSGGHHGLIKYLIQTKGIIDMNILMQHVDLFHQCKRIASELSGQEVIDLIKGYENNYLQKINASPNINLKIQTIRNKGIVLK